jgi:hypothetical protein
MDPGSRFKDPREFASNRDPQQLHYMLWEVFGTLGLTSNRDKSAVVTVQTLIVRCASAAYDLDFSVPVYV